MAKPVSFTSDLAARAKAQRGWGNILGLWRLCGDAACRRARACRGDALVCFPRNINLLPQGVREWFTALGEAQADGLTFDEAMRSLEDTPESEAFEDWSAAVAASLKHPD